MSEETIDGAAGPAGPLSPEAVAAILSFHLACGVDSTVSDSPRDWAAAPAPAPAPASAPAAPAAPRRAPEPARPAPAKGDGDVETAPPVMAARAEAGSAESLEALRGILSAFEGCPLRFTARNLVFGTGDPAARIAFVGEAPGRDEDMEGKPFVGRSGKLLERMLAAVGLSREEVFITNVLPWRPPANNAPSDLEVATCLPFVVRQIELVSPEVVVLLGGAATKALTGRTEGIRRLRGRWLTLEASGLSVPALPTLHPAYLLRQPAEKRAAWADLLAVADRLGLPAAPGGEGRG